MTFMSQKKINLEEESSQDGASKQSLTPECDCENHQDENFDNTITDEINKNSYTNSKFVESLGDITKFSYSGMCASALNLLFDAPEDREYRHTFVTSFVAHLCLPSNVANTMIALSDGHGLPGTDLFVENLLQDEKVKQNIHILLNDMVMWAVTSSGGRYDARSRFVIRHVTWQLHFKYEDFENIEELIIEMLKNCTEKEKSEQEATRKKNARNRKWKRYALIGLATAGGGALVGLTGGLAAPLVAAGAGAILGGASAAALGSVAGIAVITSLFGAAGAGLTGYKMKRRVGGIDEFEFRPLTVAAQPAITIAVSGWLSEDRQSGFVYPWKHMLQGREQYTLVWESKHLLRLGSAFQYIIDSLMSVAATEALKYTVLAGLITAVAWPASLISAAGVIDNPWSVCLQRSSQVGKQLAEVLLAREHGHRPVTLIGFSLGARVIYHCLEEMSKRKNHTGIVENVYLLGAPVSGKAEDWKIFSSVVASHITNVYCRTDWLLRFLYRTSARQVQVAGLQPIMWENRRMINIDLSSIIDGHMDYAKNMDTILAAIGVRTKGLPQKKELLKEKRSSSLPTILKLSKDSALTTSSSCDQLHEDLPSELVDYNLSAAAQAKEMPERNSTEQPALSDNVSNFSRQENKIIFNYNSSLDLSEFNYLYLQPNQSKMLICSRVTFCTMPAK
ncbi:transmembrane and coiled-coil domain-containing protein 4-like [Clavelina lepadiformis]|uniref:Transmembrane and coiled-coil domain-containing protein 4 n=1 Tax=Clavelina lepadiformis TaxID=159417 RepID=A0ABP0FVU7_CLALP